MMIVGVTLSVFSKFIAVLPLNSFRAITSLRQVIFGFSFWDFGKNVSFLLRIARIPARIVS